MTIRQFDPVFSAALRNELEAIADAGDAPARPHRPHRPVRAALARPQVWVSVITAVVLVAATIGVLQIAHRTTLQPAATTAISDPLEQITDPSDPEYVGAAPLVLLSTRGTGSTMIGIDVPPGVTSVRPYLRCLPLASFRISLGKGFSTGCDARSADYADIPVVAGRRTLALRIPADTTWRLVVIVTPSTGTTTSSTLHVTAGPEAITDPLAQITDPADQSFVARSVSPVVDVSGIGSRRIPLAVPAGVSAVRIYIVCASGADWALDGETSQCRGRITGWSDQRVSRLPSSLRLTLPAGTRFHLLVIRSPVE
ncbi:hypothetical protein [Amnibacterium kyonggiense]